MKKAGGIKLKASPPVVRSYRKWTDSWGFGRGGTQSNRVKTVYQSWIGDVKWLLVIG